MCLLCKMSYFYIQWLWLAGCKRRQVMQVTIVRHFAFSLTLVHRCMSYFCIYILTVWKEIYFFSCSISTVRISPAVVSVEVYMVVETISGLWLIVELVTGITNASCFFLQHIIRHQKSWCGQHELHRQHSITIKEIKKTMPTIVPTMAPPSLTQQSSPQQYSYEP